MFSFQIFAVLNLILFCNSSSELNDAPGRMNSGKTPEKHPPSTFDNPLTPRFEMISGSTTCKPGYTMLREDFVRTFLECRAACVDNDDCNYFAFSKVSPPDAQSNPEHLTNVLKRCQLIQTCVPEPDERKFAYLRGVLYKKLPKAQTYEPASSPLDHSFPDVRPPPVVPPQSEPTERRGDGPSSSAGGPTAHTATRVATSINSSSWILQNKDGILFSITCLVCLTLLYEIISFKPDDSEYDYFELEEPL